VYRGEELLATGSTVHAFIDRSGRPVRPPAAFSETMAALFPATPTAG
jgi:acyl-CoA thioester hydrolase